VSSPAQYRQRQEEARCSRGERPGARAGTVAGPDAAFGQVIRFAVPYSAFPELIRAFRAFLKGKGVLNARQSISRHADGEVRSPIQARRKKGRDC